MKEIYRTDISELKEFEKYGETFTFLQHNEKNNTYLYKRTNKETGKISYEVIKPKKRKTQMVQQSIVIQVNQVSVTE